MELSRSDENGTAVIRCEGERLDALVAIQFKDRFRQLVADGVKRCVLDLKGVEFLDSSGLGAVVAVYKLMGPDRKFELAGLSPPVARVFQLTRMDSVFAIHRDADAALGAAP